MIASMTARIAPDLEAEILRQWRDGAESASLLGDRVGVSQSTVLRVLARHEVSVDHEQVRRRKRRTTAEQDAEIVRRYEAGESAQKLADEYGFKTHVSVLQRVRAASRQARRPGNRFATMDADLG